MLLIICVERLLHIGSHFSLRKWRRRPHIPTKLAAVASFSYKIGGSGLIFLQNWRRRIRQHYWWLFWHGLDIGAQQLASGGVISRTRPRTFHYSIITVGRSWARKLKFAGNMDSTLTLVHKKFCCFRSNRKKNIWKKHHGHTFLKKGWLAAGYGVISRVRLFTPWGD